MQMTEPLTLATGAVAVADKLHSWYESAQAAAKTQEQKDAAALVYFAAQLAGAVATLDLEFRTTLNGIKKLDPSWTRQQRDELAETVVAVATKESRLNQLETATAFLRERTRPDSNWRERILHLRGPRRQARRGARRSPCDRRRGAPLDRRRPQRPDTLRGGRP